MIRLDKSEMTKTICSLYSFREEGRKEKANKYLPIHLGLLLIIRKDKVLKVKISVRREVKSLRKRWVLITVMLVVIWVRNLLTDTESFWKTPHLQT